MIDTLPLNGITLFSELTQHTLECIERVVIKRRYEKGELIQLEGDICEVVFFVAAGKVRIYRLSPEGREQVLVQLEAGQAFNTVPPFMPEGSNKASVDAFTDTTLYVLLKEDYLNLVQTCSDFSLAVLQDFAGRLAHLTDLVENLALHSVRGRLAKFLLDQADGEHVAQRWTQDEIASHLGTVRDMVGRALRAFMDAGLIRRERNQLVLLDRERLEAEAES